jgi:hypothetical protein
MRFLLLLLLMAEPIIAQVGPTVLLGLTDSTGQSLTPIPTLKKLTKAGVGLPLFQQSGFVSSWITTGFDAITEHKIKGGLAVVAGAEVNLSFTKGAQLYAVNMPIGLRYYFSVGKRMKQRADRHSFFSHYVSLNSQNALISNVLYSTDVSSGGVTALQYYSQNQRVTQITNTGVFTEWFNFAQFVYFRVGSQVALPKDKYLDVSVAVPFSLYRKSDYSLITPPYITIKYGLAWRH